MEFVNTHVGAYGIIINDDKIALIKKTRGGYTGKLDIPGGGIEHTENPTETLKRELMEEIGSEVLDYSLFDVADANIVWEMHKDLFEDLHHIGILYIVTLKDLNLRKEGDNIDSGGADWYNISDLSRKNLTPFAIYSLEKLGYVLK
jgi:8-oxo-dGTP pyrophosphatase MutT (NUDIX family)